MRSAVKKSISKLHRMLPIEITVRRRGKTGADLDPLEHNTETGWNRTFSNKRVLSQYISAGRTELYDAIHEICLSSLPPTASRCVIGDVGCGLGDLLRIVSESYPGSAAYGYDFAKAPLDEAAKRFPGGTFSQHNIYDAPARQHDLTICSQTLEHLVDPDIALARLVEWTKPGGVIVLTVPDGRLDSYSGHINFWSLESWRSFVRKNVGGLKHEVVPIPPKSARIGNLGAVVFTS